MRSLLFIYKLFKTNFCICKMFFQKFIKPIDFTTIIFMMLPRHQKVATALRFCSNGEGKNYFLNLS